MNRAIDETLEPVTPQHAYAQVLHAGFVFEIRARTLADRPGSYVHVLVHASPTCPHEQSAEYLIEDATASGAVRSGIVIAQAMIEDQFRLDTRRRLFGW